MFFKQPKPKPKPNYSKIGNPNLNTDFFWIDISVRQDPVRSLVFMKMIPDKVILDQKNSYKVNFEYFHFCDFFTYK